MLFWLACFLVTLCTAVFVGLLWPSPFWLCAGVAALAGYVMLMLRTLKRHCLSARRLSAVIAAPFVWAVLFYLFYQAQIGFPAAMAVSVMEAFSVWFFMRD